MPITKLSEDLINKIAAGEVVERPASVVKELVENALDAGATRISVELVDSGTTSIKVSDNGSGMNIEDAHLCLERHATSKISTALDLFNIHTLGFRGEALASIAAVSKLTLSTKDKGSELGIVIETKAGKIFTENQLAFPQGTIIEVKDIFYNVPARKKHLKSLATELKHCVEIVTQYALIHPEIYFKLCHNGTILLDAAVVESLHERIASLYGAKLAKGLLKVEFVQNDLSISGFIAKPAFARNDKSMQHLYINHRWIRNDLISKAIYDACHTVLFLDKNPVVVLNITVDPTRVDVNVHPTKTTVRLDKEQEIYQVVYEAIRTVMYNEVLVPEVVLKEKKLEQQSQLHVSHEPPYFKKEYQHALEARKENEEDILLKPLPSPDLLPEKRTIPLSSAPVSKPSPHHVHPTLRILGRIKETFIVAENDQGMLLIDQHAMHERIMYEKFMEQCFNKAIQKQQLLHPMHIELIPSEMVTLNANKELLSTLGFEIDSFGQHSFVIRTWPSIFGRMQKKELLYDLLAELNEKPTKTDEIKEERLARRSCRSAVKAHDPLEQPEIYAMISELYHCKMPYTCPHGRPTMIQFTGYELEKKFKRVH